VARLLADPAGVMVMLSCGACATVSLPCCATASPIWCRCERVCRRSTTSHGGIGTGDAHTLGHGIRHLCRRYGISDPPAVGVPRPITPGDKRALNKRIVEALANQCYWLELDNAPGQRVRAYRKAAWAIEDLEKDVGLIYRQMGRKGLEGVENVGPRLAEVVGDLINEVLPSQTAQDGRASTVAALSHGRIPPFDKEGIL